MEDLKDFNSRYKPFRDGQPRERQVNVVVVVYGMPSSLEFNMPITVFPHDNVNILNHFFTVCTIVIRY